MLPTSEVNKQTKAMNFLLPMMVKVNIHTNIEWLTFKSLLPNRNQVNCPRLKEEISQRIVVIFTWIIGHDHYENVKHLLQRTELIIQTY